MAPESGKFIVDTANYFVNCLGTKAAVWQNDVRVLPSMPLTVADDRDIPLSGGNALLLVQAMWDRGWRDPRFLTERQISEIGASVMPDAEKIDVQFMRAIGADGSLLEQPEVVTFSLFNAEHIQGLTPFVAPKRDWSLEVLAERLLPKFDVRIVHDQQDRAFFSVDDGNVHMPPLSAFRSVGEYVGVAVHELSHATSVELNREVFGKIGQPGFAREELRAELASMQLSIALGIPHDTERHAGFAGEWATVLRDDPNELFNAARDAEKMAALVFWHVKAVERELAAERVVNANEVAPAVIEKPERVVYTVSASRNFESKDFEDAAEAARAFHRIDAVDRPAVIRTVGNPSDPLSRRANVIAQTTGKGTLGEGMQYWKYSGNQDPEFDMAFQALTAAKEVMKEVVPEPAQAVATQEVKSAPRSAADKRRGYQRGVYTARAEELFSTRQAVLAVPFDDRAEAQNLGAVFYGPQKVWFIPAGIDMAPLRKWSVNEGLGSVARLPSHGEMIADFEKTMAELKLSTAAQIVADGKWHHVEILDHHKKQKSGSYILNLDGGRDGRPTGHIMNRLSGESIAWKMDCPGLTPEQLARMRAESLLREEQATREIAARQESAAEAATEIWGQAAVANHGYFDSKAVEGHGARVVDGATLLGYSAFKGESGGSIIRARERYALVPLMDDAQKIWSLQAISEDGKTKVFMSGARKKGLFCVLGDAGIGEERLPSAGKLGFVEGFATGASLFEASKFPVVICFDAGNLESVARDFGKRLPAEIKPVIGADNDQFFMERAFGALARIGAIASSTGEMVKVVSGQGESRDVALGEVVADGEWHQASGGRYRVSLEDDPGQPGCVAKVAVEIIRNGAAEGQRETLRAGNRGLEAARVAAEALPGAVVVIPKFSTLAGRPTDWNDLAKQKGDVGSQVREQLGENLVVSRDVGVGKLLVGRGR